MAVNMQTIPKLLLIPKTWSKRFFSKIVVYIVLFYVKICGGFRGVCYRLSEHPNIWVLFDKESSVLDPRMEFLHPSRAFFTKSVPYKDYNIYIKFPYSSL